MIIEGSGPSHFWNKTWLIENCIQVGAEKFSQPHFLKWTYRKVLQDCNMKKEFNLIATVAAGLEAVVGREVRELGYDCQVENGRVRFQGDVRAIIETNLCLRAADRIKIIVGTFPAKTFEELFQGVFALDWENYLPLGARFPISKAKCVKSKLHNEPSVQAISKKAVVKKLQKHYARPEGVPLMENGPEFKIEVSILKDVATVMIDTTGSSLFKRGYRTEKGGAPIKENMAAAILQLSNWYPDKPLIDPTCGSGTFCIEAVMIARKMAPGLRRSFAFEEWNWISDRLIQEVRTEAAKKVDRELELDIMGCDIDARMVEIAKANAQAAGVAGDITFKQMRVQDLRSDKINGVIISNPPYGERLSDDAGVTKLYAEMGQVFAPLKTWSKFILTSDEAFETKYGSQADKKRKLYNGTLKVDLYQYFGQRVKRQELKQKGILMSKKRRNLHKKEVQEPRFDFDEAKELTVGQAIRKNEEVEAGVLPEDSILDKYVKQHKDEIEADKFETRQFSKDELVEKEEVAVTSTLDDLLQEIREETEVESSVQEDDLNQFDDLEFIRDSEVSPVEEFETEEVQLFEGEEVSTLSRVPDSEDEKSKKKWVLYGILVTLVLLILGTAYYVYRQVARSTKEIQTSQSTTNPQAEVEEFNNLYDAFYTDSNKTALKNSQFDKLSQLKTLLDKLEGSREHALAKSKYDSLATQIKAIQDVNAQFEKPAIVDGVLDTNAKVKSDAKFTDIKTGNTEIDKVLDKAISLGKSQQTSTSSSSSSQTSSSSQASSNTTSETKPSSSNETRSTRGEVNMGLSSAGVAVQRSASRVAYNQSAIDDSNNSAWDFADGVLEQILATSRSRGYITGNQYILERVNIVNGNGYYNLYKPDGTYLFTLNCKTGYFVGNGSGHADALDY